MATTITRENERWNNRTVTVPYTVQVDEADGYLFGITAENALASRVLLDFGVLPTDFDADRESDYAIQFSLTFDRRQVSDYETYVDGGSSGTFTPAASYVEEVRIHPPGPLRRQRALSVIQKGGTSGTPPNMLWLNQSSGWVDIEPPRESNTIEATFPTVALATTFREATTACMHRLNDGSWFGHDAGTVMLLRAGAVRQLGGLSVVSIGFAIGAKRTVVRGLSPLTVTLSDVLPFSRITEIVEQQSEEFLGTTVPTGTTRAVYEHEVYERADYSQLNLPYAPT